jgi:hypothetical protein
LGWEEFRRRCKSENHLGNTLRSMLNLSRKWKGGTITRRRLLEKRWILKRVHQDSDQSHVRCTSFRDGVERALLSWLFRQRR